MDAANRKAHGPSQRDSGDPALTDGSQSESAVPEI